MADEHRAASDPPPTDVGAGDPGDGDTGAVPAGADDAARPAAGAGPDGPLGPIDADGDGDDGDDSGGGLWAAVGPRGPVQVAVAVAAVCFLAGAVGYLLGTRQAPVPTSDTDVGFLLDMSTHHEQAVTMALCSAGKAKDPVVGKFAQEVLVLQNRELGQMAAWLEQRKVARPEEDEARPAMAWMGMTATAATMPGMATPEQIKRLCAASTTDLDRDFLVLMRAHHLGGVHMAEHAAEHAASERLREFAATMARNQRSEVGEYTAVLKRLGAA